MGKAAELHLNFTRRVQPGCENIDSSPIHLPVVNRQWLYVAQPQGPHICSTTAAGEGHCA
jgi:hypothetical protein